MRSLSEDVGSSARYPAVVLREEGMRDGLQIERLGVSVDQKLRLLTALTEAGLRRIVVGSFVSPKWTPQMADVDELMGRIQPRDGVTYLGVALNDKGWERMRSWVPPLTLPDQPESHLHVDEVFLKRNTNKTFAQQDEALRRTVKLAVESGATSATIGLSAGWGSNWSGQFSPQTRLAALRRQYDAWAEVGVQVTRIAMADPMGWNSPAVVAADLRAFEREFPSVGYYHLHMHNARGLALVSAYAALTTLNPAFTLELDSGIGGMGGCPYCGNGRAAGLIPTEDLAQMLATLGIETGIDLYRLVDASHLAAEIVQRDLDGHVSKAGPLPDGEHLYDLAMPVVESHHEAQHFRLGRSVYAGQRQPW